MKRILLALCITMFACMAVPAYACKTVEECLPLAEQGDSEAQHNLGYIYEIGKGTPQNYPEAVKWYKSAAEQGYAQGQYSLATMYFYGLGTTKDDVEALRLFLKSSKQGLLKAKLMAGLMYVSGMGTTQDVTLGLPLIQEAAKAGLTAAQSALGRLYLEGLAVPQDYIEAYAWLHISSSQGFEMATERRDIMEKELSPEDLIKAQALSKEYHKKYVEPFQ